MSTRATYKFVGDEFTPDVTVYIHHDGYPSGAAGYLSHLFDESREGRQLVADFIRANAGAEVTSGHEAHGDTEYAYTITGDTAETAKIEVLEYAIYFDRAKKVSVIFEGLLIDFVSGFDDNSVR